MRQHEDKGDMLTQGYRGQAIGLPKNVLVEPYPEMRGEPQMTAGIGLDRIFRIMENLDKAKRTGESKTHHEARRKGNAVLMGKPASPKRPWSAAVRKPCGTRSTTSPIRACSPRPNRAAS